MITISKKNPIKNGVVYTIGYEGVVIDTFIQELKKSGIKQVIDVRRNPISRKSGFSKNKLMERLLTDGISYIHIPELGIPSSMRKNLQLKEDYIRLLNEYETKLLPEAQLQKEVLIEHLKKTPSALLCFEADPEYCHRSRLANVIANETGLQQIHIHYSR
ncbi:MAG: DUF488 domain-containing protein [Planctomycetaceae bacterium]|jgi:uncharacterized protein (DUF488 family)|nr:DUF488 domain-containing protein [Planctomycetaceae bacterium]